MRIEDKDPDRHNAIEYPMEVGAPKFAPVPIKLQERLDATEMVHAAKFTFNPVYGKKYYLYQDQAISGYRLVQNSPREWSCGIPDGWSFCQAVRKMGDSTWEIVEEDLQ